MKNTYTVLMRSMFICGVILLFQISSTCAQLSAQTPATTPTATPASTPVLPNPIAVTTGETTNVTSNSATLHGTGSGRGLTKVWFEYDTASGSYQNTSSVQEVNGSPFDMPISADITGLVSNTTYFYRIVGQNSSDDISYGSEKSFTTLSATATPAVTATPGVTPVATTTPVCEAASLGASPKRLTLQRGQAGEMTVILEGDNCFPAGKIVTANISKVGSKRVSVSPKSAITDEAGKATFTITAKDKTGKAKVTFNTWSLKKSVTVKIR